MSPERGTFFIGENMSCTHEDLDTLIADLETANYTIDDLTQETLTGAGVFDVLMRALENHLEREHTANRITGDQYAATYTQLTGVVLQQSIQFLLGLGKLQLENNLTTLQNEKLKKEIQLLCQKLVTEKAQVMDSTVLDPTATDAETPTNPDTGDKYNSTVQPVEGTIGERNRVLCRQVKGFDDNYKTNVGKAVLDTYRTLLSNLGGDSGISFPPSIQDGGVEYMMKTLKTDAGLQDLNNADYLGDSRATDEANQGDYYWKADHPTPTDDGC